jgi:dienelactone hydrolase
MQPSLSPRIFVDQPVALYDAPISIALEGFGPRTRVTVTATFQVAEATPWRSWATFIADDSGRVDVTRQPPVAGTWEGVSPMGLFWSTTPVPGKWRSAPPDWVMWPSVARLRAEAPGVAPAELTVERRLAGDGVSRRPVREAGVVGTLFLPPGDWPHPAVIVLGGSDGGISEHRAALVASHGYAALSLAYLGAASLPSELVNIPVEYFEHAIGWMRGQPWLRDGFLAVWGASRGGELALLLGATIPAINAVIAYVASGVLHGPFEPHDPPDTPACWTSGGQPLPYLQEHNATDDPTSVDYTKSPVAESPRYLSQLRDLNAVERATIPAERTQGPILLVSGQDDQIWPSSILAEIAIRRLRLHGHTYPFCHLSYEGAGHAIYIPYSPTTQIEFTHPNGVHYTGGGSPRANSEAGADAWRHVLAFLEESTRFRR